jgi:hypothetical protein
VTNRFLITVDRFADGEKTTQAMTVTPPDDLTPAQTEMVDRVAQALIDMVAELPSVNRHDAVGIAACLVLEQYLDRRAYEREAERRGVLAL